MSCFDCNHYQRLPEFLSEGGDLNRLQIEIGGKYGYPNESCAKPSYLAVAGQHVCLQLKSTFYTARQYGECRYETDLMD